MSSSAQPSSPSARRPDHRFTLSDYYTAEALDTLRAHSDSSSHPPPSASASAAKQQFADRHDTFTPNPIPASSSSRPGRKGPPPPPIITTTEPPAPLSLSRATTVENSLELDLFDTGSSSSRRPSISPSPSPDPLGVMSHPLGPGPQPYPVSTKKKRWHNTTIACIGFVTLPQC